MARLAMLIDLTRCIGCDACTVACKQENGTPADVFFARVLNVEAGAYPNTKRIYIPVLCNHCENPACLNACPNKAIFRREDGIVLIDQDRCKGTGACVSACPYGNIVLKKEDAWYLPEDRAYERDHVKPRLKPNVARKCTLCAPRVDEGLEPACVVACPTTARIFGDTEDPDSKISRYVAEQKEETGRDPFKLLPECGTHPANMYLGTMVAQESSTLESPAPAAEVKTPAPDEPVAPTPAPPGPGAPNGHAPKRELMNSSRKTIRNIGAVLLAALLLAGGRARAQQPDAPVSPASDQTTVASAINPQPSTLNPNSSALNQAQEVWSASACAGCHGPTAMGGFGPPLAGTKLDMTQFTSIVRHGKGMMPAIPPSEVSDAELASIHQLAQATKLDPSQIPISYKVGALLSVRNVGVGFGVITLVALLLALRVLGQWMDRAGWRLLRPYVRRFGYGRAAGVVLKALVVDGLCVASLWRKDKFRWAMHGLLLYGFLAIGLADILMSIFNPTRAGLPFLHPLKILPNLGGLAVLAGVVYVRRRYQTDPYIDNGLTIGRDYLFINLLALTILSGFLVQILRSGGGVQFVMPVYMVHLTVIATMFVSAPYTRFAHVFVVPALVSMTRLTEAITASGTELAFANEPSPGRHHKSMRIAAQVIQQVDPGFEGKLRIRYYP